MGEGEGQRKRRLNVRPHLLVLLVLAIAAGLNWRYFSTKAPPSLLEESDFSPSLGITTEEQIAVAQPAEPAAAGESKGGVVPAAPSMANQAAVRAASDSAAERSSPPSRTEVTASPRRDLLPETGQEQVPAEGARAPEAPDLPEAMKGKWAWVQQSAGLEPGHIEGRFAQSVNTSKGVYSDRSYTVFESTLELSGAQGINEFALRWRGRYAPGEEFSENIPSSYLEEAWYRWGDPDGPYRLTLGRHYIEAAATELIDGLSVESRAGRGPSLGVFLGFRPDPYDFDFRPDAFSTGLFSSWRNAAGRTYSRQALVFNVFETELDRTYFTWEAGTVVRKNMTVRQYVVLDVDLDSDGLTLTDYALDLGAQPVRDLYVSWRGEIYRNIFFEQSSEDIPADTSATYTTSLALRYVFSRHLTGRASIEYRHRDLDQSESLSWSLGLDLPDLLRSGATFSLLYSATDYYNAFFDSYSASLTRAFGQRLTLNLGLKYWRNFTDQLQGRSESNYYAVSGGATYLVSERIDLSAYYEFQQARFENGPTLGLGFDRSSDPTGTADRADGHNFSLIFQYRF